MFLFNRYYQFFDMNSQHQFTNSRDEAASIFGINLFFKKGSKEVETATNSEIIEYKIHFRYIHRDKNYYLVYNEGVLMKHEGWSINKAERAQF